MMSKLQSLENFKDRNVTEGSAYYNIDGEAYPTTGWDKFKQVVNRICEVEFICHIFDRKNGRISSLVFLLSTSLRHRLLLDILRVRSSNRSSTLNIGPKIEIAILLVQRDTFRILRPTT